MKKLSYITIFVVALGLIAFAQPEWTEYSGNPVFGEWIGGPKAYYPSVLYDPDGFEGQDPSYKYMMWYGTSGSTTGLVISKDGVNWDELGVVMIDGYHATVKYFPDGFSGTNSGENPNASMMYYRMWYWDVGTLYNVAAIGYAESYNGVIWFNFQPCQNSTVPIISGGDPWWNRGSYGPCDVLYNPDASNTGTDWTFTMYYDGTTGGDEAIGLGFSSDCITWTGYDADSDGKADPVFNGTYVSGDWDENYVSRATIIKNADDDYEMWYSGGIGKMNHGIGYATSSDGINWTRDANNPIFHKDDGIDWRNSRTYCPSVIKDGNTYKMWFAGVGSDYSIGYATAAPPVIDMTSFVVEKAKIDFKKKPDDDKVRVKGKLDLDLVNGDGVYISDDVIVTVGPLSETITMVEKEKKSKKWEYKRPKGGTGDIKKMTIDWKNGKFDIRMDKADLTEVTNPVTISIQIGDDLGTDDVMMKVHKHHWDYHK